MVSMRNVALALTGLAVAAILPGCDGGETPVFPTENSYCQYFPLDVGNKWVYKVTVDTRFEPPTQYDLTYEVTSIKKNYNGYPIAYIITVTKDTQPYDELTTAYDDDGVYLSRAMWSYLIADDMEKGGWSQSGLVNDDPLTYSRDDNVTVPAGEYNGCRVLSYENGNEYQPMSWEEFYYKNVGLVYYKYAEKEYESSPPYTLLDWRVVEYSLESFTAQP